MSENLNNNDDNNNNNNVNMNAHDYKYEQFQEVLRSLPIQQYCSGLLTEEIQDVGKLCDGFLKIVQGNLHFDGKGYGVDLNLEEISSLYVVSIMLFVLGPNRPQFCSKRLELLNECFNYSDTLKPTMIDYSTRNILEKFKQVAKSDESHTDYMMQLIEAIPHMVVASETGKMLSLGLLRAFIAELTGTVPPIVMHIYRNLTEIWLMLKSVDVEAMMEEWSLRKIYLLIKSFCLLVNAAAFGPSTALKHAGYRGFELPPNVSEIVAWFKALKTSIEIKHKESKAATALVYYIDLNILRLLSENESETLA